MKSFSFLAIGIIFIYFAACTEGRTKTEYKYRKPVGDGVVLKSGDISITEKEMVTGIEMELFDAEEKLFKLKFERVKSLLLKRLIEKDPKGKNLSVDEFIEKNIASSIKVSKSEIEAFIKEKNIPKEHVNDNIKQRIRAFLVHDKKRYAVEDWMAKKIGKQEVSIFLTKPKRPTFDVNIEGAPAYGPADAKVTIVEYSDFQCPYCAKGSETMTELKKKYKGKIKVVFKNFPLPNHNQAKQAAVAAMCAYDQSSDLFWKMHDQLFKDQSKLSSLGLKETAAKLGLEVEKFNTCLDSNKHIQKVEDDIAQGKKLGIKSTPTFFVNGQLVAGALPPEEFAKLIDEQLAQ